MEARPLPLTPEVKALVPNGVTSERDKILVVGDPPSGAMVYRPAVWIHELECGKDMVSRLRASALVDAAMKQDGSRCAVFIVAGDNERMQRFVEGLGAVRQSDPGDVLYTLTI